MKIDREFRTKVGPHDRFDRIGGFQFVRLFGLGMKAKHKVLDVGCGCLRAGRLLIAYLDPGNYYGIEPDKGLLQYGIDNEAGPGLIKDKEPVFSHTHEFFMEDFDVKFDFILAHSIFSHATKPWVEVCCDQVKEVLAPNGFFVFTFFKGAKDNEREEWFDGRVEFTQDFMERTLEAVGLKWAVKPWPHPTNQTWVVAKR